MSKLEKSPARKREDRKDRVIIRRKACFVPQGGMRVCEGESRASAASHYSRKSDQMRKITSTRMSPEGLKLYLTNVECTTLNYKGLKFALIFI